MKKPIIFLAVFLIVTFMTSCSNGASLKTEVNPTGAGSVNPSNGQYEKGDKINISANARDGMVFDHWSGDVSGTGTSIDVLMDSNKNITANFLPVYTIETNSDPPGAGTISPSRGNYKSGSTINITAQPAPGYAFDKWGGNIIGNTAVTTFSVDSNKNITAYFKPTHKLEVKIFPPGTGTVSPTENVYKEGDTVTLTANPATGFNFAGWSGDITGDNSTESVVINSDKTIIANFKDLTPPGDVKQLMSLINGHSVKLSWQEPSDNDFSKVEISFDGPNSPVVVNKGTTIAEITGLDGQKTYTFTVKTVDTSGNKSKGVQINATIPFSMSTDYFKISDGWGINYQVTDQYNGHINCNAWVISQYNKVRLNEDFDFVFTLTQDGNTGGYYANSVLGGLISLQGSTSDVTGFRLGNPSANQGNIYMMFMLPRVFNPGDSWNWFGRQFKVEKIDAQTINGNTFSDCIKVSLVNWDDTNPYLKGDGYFILAKDVGIVELVFNRTNGTTVKYEYIKSQQFDENAANAILNSIVIR